MSPSDLEALDRLEQKITQLVGEMTKLRAAHAKQGEEHRRLTADLDAARARLEEAETGAAETAVLRKERDQVRARVAGILEHLEGLEI
jgi:regulator of replication initiation timing